MSKLQELIEKLCPNGIEHKKLIDVTELKRGVRVTKNQLSENGLYPVFQNSLIPLGYYDKSNCTANTTFIISAGAAGEIGYSTEDFWAADDCLFFVSEIVDSRYLYHFLLNQQDLIKSKVRRASIPRLSRLTVENIDIPVPPIEVQREVVRILDNFTELTTELTAELETELETRKKQYNHYKNTFFAEYNKTKYKLKDVADIYLGLTYTPRYVDNGIKFISSQNISKDYLDLENNIKYISKEEFENCTNNAKPKKGDVLFTRVGSNLGHPTVVDTDEPLCIFVSLGYLRAKEEYVLGSYLKHWMNSEAFWDQVKKKTKNIPKVNLNSSWMRKFDISIPNIEKQRHIVTILDQYDKLRKDLFDELTAEIATQQKQYEYYRDKLLTFKGL